MHVSAACATLLIPDSAILRSVCINRFGTGRVDGVEGHVEGEERVFLWLLHESTIGKY